MTSINADVIGLAFNSINSGKVGQVKLAEPDPYRQLME